MAAGRLSVMREGEVLATLADMVPPSGSIAGLTGPRQARARAVLLSVILDRRATQAEAGFNALREALRVGLGIDRGTIASVDWEISRAVLEHRRDRAKAATMTADDILKVWASW